MTVTVYRHAPKCLRDLNDLGTDEDYIIVGEVNDDDPSFCADFHYVVESLDCYDHGSGTIHRTEYEGKLVDVYIIAHS